jgi:predicted methyltransferase
MVFLPMVGLGTALLPGALHNGNRYVVRPRAAANLFEPERAPELLEGPARDRWQKPAQLVAALRLKPGEAVADIGAGSGYLLPHLSRAVGPAGTVYAEEIQEAFLPALRRHAERLGNICVALGTPDDPNLPPERVDCFVLLTVYHEIERPSVFLRALQKSARTNAKLAIIDFDPDRKGDPPPPPGHSVREDDVIAEARAAGWKLKERHTLVPSQFFLIFRR